MVLGLNKMWKKKPINQHPSESILLLVDPFSSGFILLIVELSSSERCGPLEQGSLRKTLFLAERICRIQLTDLKPLEINGFKHIQP